MKAGVQTKLFFNVDSSDVTNSKLCHHPDQFDIFDIRTQILVIHYLIIKTKYLYMTWLAFVIVFVFF